MTELSANHDLITMSFLKWAMIVIMKMQAAGEIFGKICYYHLSEVAYFRGARKPVQKFKRLSWSWSRIASFITQLTIWIL